jgi:hypothetical protein
MVRRPAPPPKPKPPTLTVGQKRRRIEPLQKCVAKLQEFDPQKARNRAPAVLDWAIDKALASAFGYGMPGYMRHNQAATLDPARSWQRRGHAQTRRGQVGRPCGTREGPGNA